MVFRVHSPALGVQARGERFLSKQMRTSWSSPLVQEV